MQFSALNNPFKLAGQYSVRQMIAHEIEKELLRRHEVVEDRTAAATAKHKGKPNAQDVRYHYHLIHCNSIVHFVLIIHRHFSAPPLEVVTEKVATDFFGRTVVSKPVDTDMDDMTGMNGFNFGLSYCPINSNYLHFSNLLLPENKGLVSIPRRLFKRCATTATS